MHTKTVACLMLAALVAAGAGCAPDESGPPAGGTSTVTASTAPAGSKPTVTSVRHSGQRGDLTFDVLLPQIEGGNAEAAKEFNQAMSGLLEGFLTQYAATRSVQDPGQASAVVHLGAHVVSGKVGVSVDFGGVHPLFALATHVTNLDTGQAITLSSTFTSEAEGLRVLSEQARVLLPETRAAKAGATLDYDGITPTAEHFSRWAVTPDGMRLYFEPGQVAPPVGGVIDITVPWSALDGVLAPGMRDILSS
ncbi:DUF3298 domain-containing protein [Nocardia huaxiensis]|uniref:DUF3298 domain-containing protein n=1 Tax=Nocardia huaxiensis TaxID=2755382 RepID=A0A7D6VCU7_9NOCA|nr:RsiV family protein [Nocardia huaxiensis]QLY29295.1 DUF3298 domain-containing protein [Nocardia huaxiensis]